VREQYWYHLEFQLNLLISLIGIFVALGTSIMLDQGFNSVVGTERMAAAIIVCLFVCYGLLMAARKNYERHIAKMASLLTALLSQSEDEADSPDTTVNN
jgi:high-affinity Fe2+/Pb2+ permease